MSDSQPASSAYLLLIFTDCFSFFFFFLSQFCLVLFAIIQFVLLLTLVTVPCSGIASGRPPIPCHGGVLSQLCALHHLTRCSWLLYHVSCISKVPVWIEQVMGPLPPILLIF